MKSFSWIWIPGSDGGSDRVVLEPCWDLTVAQALSSACSFPLFCWVSHWFLSPLVMEKPQKMHLEDPRKMEIHEKLFFCFGYLNTSPNPCHNKFPFKIDGVYSPLSSLATWQVPRMDAISWVSLWCAELSAEPCRGLCCAAPAPFPTVHVKAAWGQAPSSYVDFSDAFASFLKISSMNLHVYRSFLSSVIICFRRRTS